MFIRITFLLALTCSALALLALLVGYAMPTGQLAIDPETSGYRRSIVLLDMARHLAQRVTRDEADNYSPAWSPDGRRLAYISVVGGSCYVMVSDAYGGRRFPVFASPVLGQSNASVAWSPEGERLAFTAILDGWQVIYVADLTQKTVQQITSSSAGAASPSWSADGRSLTFSWSPVANVEVYRVDVRSLDVPVSRTSSVTRLTDNMYTDMWPAWSPDGRYIAFTTDRDDNSEIYVMNPDGGSLRRLTHHLARDILPAWTPDSRYALFASDRGGSWQIYQIAADCGLPGDCTEQPAQLTSGSNTLRASLRP